MEEEHVRPPEAIGEEVRLLTIDAAGRDRWLLGPVEDHRGARTPASLGLRGRIAGGAGLRVRIESPGEELDYNCAMLSQPIVRPALAELLDEIAPGCVQRLPVDIPGARAAFELLVVLGELDWDAVRAWHLETKRPVGEAPVAAPGMFRTGEPSRPVGVTRAVWERLVASPFTGMAFARLRKPLLADW